MLCGDIWCFPGGMRGVAGCLTRLLGFLQELCSSSVLQVFYLMSFFFSCLNWQQTGNLRLADWFIIAFIAVNMRFIGNYCSQQDYSEVLPSIVDGDV